MLSVPLLFPPCRPPSTKGWMDKNPPHIKNSYYVNENAKLKTA